MRQWIANNAAQLVTIITLILTCLGLIFVHAQLKQSNEHQRWNNYNQLNLHYSALYRNMPDELHRSKCITFNELPLKGQRWIRSYFNLYSEEHYLFQENFIPEEMWTERIDNGVAVNLKHYPVLVEGYKYWKNEGSFKHPHEFIPYVDKKISSLEKEINQILSACGNKESNKSLKAGTQQSGTP